jgi:hypothetical protein
MTDPVCNYVMANGNDIEGIRILYKVHDIPEFIPLSRCIQTAYNGSIDDMAFINPLFADPTVKDKLKLNALETLQATVADLVMLKSIHDEVNLDTTGTDVRNMFLALPLRWKDSMGQLHGIDSTKDLAKAIQASMTTPHVSHSFYDKELVLYIPTTGLYCSRSVTPDCQDLSKIFTKVPVALTKLKVDASTSVSVGAAADAIAARVKAGADADTTVSIDVSSAPIEVRTRYYSRLDRNKVVLQQDLSRFKNDLTTDSRGTVNEWNFVEYPPIEQSYVITRDGTCWSFLNHQEKVHRQAFKDHFIPLAESTPDSWFKFCLHLEYTASINRMWIHSYFCHELVTGGTDYGFVVADPTVDCDADFPIKYSNRIGDWSQQLYNVFAKSGNVPKDAQSILLSCQGNGYLFLRRMHCLLNPALMDIPSSVCSTIPTQHGRPFIEYVWSVQFRHHMLGYIQNRSVDLGDRHVQDMFISNMDNSAAIIQELYYDRESTLKSKTAKFEANTFINTMSLVVNTLFGNDSIGSSASRTSSARPSRSTSKPSSFTRHKTNATNIVQASSEFLPDPDFTSAGLYSLAFEDIDVDSCNDAEVGLLSSAINQIGSNLNTAFDTTRPCVICGGTGHTFDGCKALLDSAGVKTAYIKLRVALNRIHSIAGKFGQPDINELQCHTISSLNIAERSFGSSGSLGGSRPGSSGGTSTGNSSILRLMKIQTQAMSESNRLVSARLSSLEELVGDTGTSGGDDDGTTGTGNSSLNETNMANFLRAASKR